MIADETHTLKKTFHINDCMCTHRSRQLCFLFVDPVYPKPTDLRAILLNSTSFALTWNHPDTSELEEEDQDEHLSYSIKGVLVSNSATVLQYSSNISSDVVPWEVVDLSDWECQDVELAVSLERDCRELFTTVSLPLCESPKTLPNLFLSPSLPSLLSLFLSSC